MQENALLEGKRIFFKACGREWQLFRPDDLESVWEQMGELEFDADERLPYWLELWPACLGLVRFLEAGKKELVGKVCLDLGCGLGLSAMVGAFFGARVLGLDYELSALRYAALSAQVNRIGDLHFVLMDWRTPALRRRVADLIWGSDIIYELRFIGPMLEFLEYALKPEGRVWIADPKRNIFPAFKVAAERSGWQTKLLDCIQGVRFLKADCSSSINIWELTRLK